MSLKRWAAQLPYVVLLAAAALLYAVSGTISFNARPGQLGPSSWPKAALCLLVIACVYEIVRRVFFDNPRPPIPDEQDGVAVEPEGRRYPWLLAGGVALTLAYAFLVARLGFFLSTFFYVIAFMYLGRFRRHAAIWLLASAMTLIIGFLFLRVVYVSLPRGEPPFDQVIDFLRILVGG